jgi:hypothetical protein
MVEPGAKQLKGLSGVSDFPDYTQAEVQEPEFPEDGLVAARRFVAAGRSLTQSSRINSAPAAFNTAGCLARLAKPIVRIKAKPEQRASSRLARSRRAGGGDLPTILGAVVADKRLGVGPRHRCQLASER